LAFDSASEALFLANDDDAGSPKIVVCNNCTGSKACKAQVHAIDPLLSDPQGLAILRPGRAGGGEDNTAATSAELVVTNFDGQNVVRVSAAGKVSLICTNSSLLDAPFGVAVDRSSVAHPVVYVANGE
jgi:hypothetical protein